MKNFKLFSSYEAEENWLSEKAASGWLLIKKGVFYTFRRQEAKDTIFAVDYRRFKSKSEYLNYVTLFEDSGWKHIAGSRYSGEQYFAVQKQEGENRSIFSDQTSSHARYKVKAAYHCKFAFLFMSYLIIFGTNYLTQPMTLNPQSAFFTPGLWEKTGVAFWQSFLFELPFALIFRILPLYVILVCIVLAFVYALWALYCGKKDKKVNHNQEKQL